MRSKRLGSPRGSPEPQPVSLPLGCKHHASNPNATSAARRGTPEGFARKLMRPRLDTAGISGHSATVICGLTEARSVYRSRKLFREWRS